MNSNSSTDINGFASNTTTISQQLRALIAQEVALQLAPVLKENARLRSENAALKARLAEKEREEDGPDEKDDEPGNPGGREGFRIEKEVAALRDRVADLEGSTERSLKAVWKDIVDHDEAIGQLEATAPRATDPTEKTKGHFQHVKALLLHSDHGQGTVKFLASRLEVCKRQAWNIIHRMEREGLINVIWDPRHKQRRIVELRQQIGTCA